MEEEEYLDDDDGFEDGNSDENIIKDNLLKGNQQKHSHKSPPKFNDGREGTLYMEIQEAKLSRDVKVLRKMDPYVVFDYKGVEFKTEVDPNAGKNPIWNQLFTIPVMDQLDRVCFKVMDKDIMQSEFIASLDLKLATVCEAAGGFNEWLDLKFKNKSAGKIKLKCHYEAEMTEEVISENTTI